MKLIRGEVRGDGSEKRLFGCSICNFIETVIAADPLKSDAVMNLVNAIRPPS